MNIIPEAYFCTTPYQIITAIALKKQTGQKADIYIVPQFKMAAQYAENIGKLNIFNNVRLVDTTSLESHKAARSKLLMHIGIVGQYFKVNKIGKEILIPDTEYTKIYVSSKAYIPRMAYLYCVKNDVNTELVYYDDGEGSYYNKYRIEATGIDKVIRRIIFGKKSIEGSHVLYLYNPELYRAINGNHWNGEIREIAHSIKKSNIKEHLSQIFDIGNQDLINEKVVILDVLKPGKYAEEDITKLYGIYERIRERFTFEQTIVKKHPRDKSTELGYYKCYENYNIPFECLCTQMDMDNKVLIAVSSTAVVIPKLLLGEEPVVILLYKIIKQINQSEDYLKKQDMFYELCKKSYKDPDRFTIPTSYDELINILNTFAEQ